MTAGSGATSIRGALAAMVVCAVPCAVDAQESRDTSVTIDWVVESAPQVALWYHGLAVLGFGLSEDSSLYNRRYADRIRDEKERRGVFPTTLDEEAARLKRELEKEQAFQLFHFLPQYFPTATRERLFAALLAVAERSNDTSVLGNDTRVGIRVVADAFDSGGKRRWLKRYVEALQTEWEEFYGAYWQEGAGYRSERDAEIQRRWNEEVAPAVTPYLREHDLDSGRIFVVEAVGQEGRLFEGRGFRRTPNSVAVWDPGWNDPSASLFAAVREQCYAVVNDALRGGGVRSAEEAQRVSGPAAVRCPALLFAERAPELVLEYQRTYLRAAGVTAEDGTADSAFAAAYEVPSSVFTTLERLLAPGGTVASREEAARPTWRVQSQPQVDLWFHALAVIAADQPGPLGLYSADYASRIREIKRERGIYPTRLDSVAPDLRRRIAEDNTLDAIHFVPLYFARATPERMFTALRAVGRRRTEDMDLVGPDVRYGVLVLAQSLASGGDRGVLRDLVDAAEDEWNVFYKEYWEEQNQAEKDRDAGVQAMWDSLFVVQLGPYLERRRLTAGTVLPSPALGPEGRIIDVDPYVPNDQVVSVQAPLATSGPDATVFAFLKELCFLLIDDRDLRRHAGPEADIEDMRRTAAVRCGALILQFYAPTLTARYRRVFLDAVGAEEASTVGAFERVYALDPEVYELIREEIRRR